MVKDPPKKKSINDFLEAAPQEPASQGSPASNGGKSINEFLEDDPDPSFQQAQPSAQPVGQGGPGVPSPGAAPVPSTGQGMSADASQPPSPAATAQGGVDELGDTFATPYTLPSTLPDVIKAQGFTFKKVGEDPQKRGDERIYRSRYGNLGLDEIEQVRAKAEGTKKQVAGMVQGYNADHAQLEFAQTDLEGKRQQLEQLAKADPIAARQAYAEYEQMVGDYNGMAQSLNKQGAAIADIEGGVKKELEDLSRRERAIKMRHGTWAGAAHNAIVDGIGSMVAGMNSPVIDILSGLAPKDMLTDDPNESRDAIAKRIKKDLLPDIRETPSKMWGVSGTTKEYMEDMESGFFGGALMGLARSAPAMATPFMIGIGLQTADAIEQEMSSPEFADISENEKNAVKAAVALPAMMLERLGFTNLAKNTPFVKNLLASSLSKIPVGASKEEIDQILQAEVRDGATNFLLKSAGGFAAEAETGGAQAIAEIGTKDLYNMLRGPDGDGKSRFATPETLQEYSFEVLKAAAQEGVGGMVMSLPYAVSAALKKNEVGKVATPKQFEVVEGILKDPNFEEVFNKDVDARVESGELTPVQAQEVKSDFAAAKKVSDKIPADLPLGSRMKAFDLISQREALRKLDPALVATKVQAINEKLAALEGVPETPEPTVTKEGEKTEPKPVQPTGEEVVEVSSLTPQEDAVQIGSPTETVVREAPTGSEEVRGPRPEGGEVAPEGPQEAEQVAPVAEGTVRPDAAPNERTKEEDAGSEMGGDLPKGSDVGPVDEGRAARTTPPTDTGEATSVPVAPPQSRRERQREQKRVLKEVDNVSEEELGPVGIVTRYLANGGRVNTESLIRELGLRNPATGKTGAELRGKVWAHDKKSKSIERVAEEIAASSNLNEMEVRNALIDVLRDAPGRNALIEDLRAYLPATQEQMEQDFYNRAVEDDFVEQEARNAGVTAEEADAHFAEAQSEWDAYTPEQKQAIFDELDAATQADTEADAGATEGATGDSVLGSEKGEGSKGEAEDAKSLADRIDAAADALEKKLKGITGAFPVPPTILVGAMRAAAQVVRAGETVANAVKAAIAHIRDTKWYKDLGTADKGKAEREVREQLRVALEPREPKKAPASSVKKVVTKNTGVRPEPKKVTVNEMTALKDRIRLEARAAREAGIDIRKQQAAFAASVGEALKELRGKVSPAQVSSLTTRAAKVNVTNPTVVAKYLNYVDRVIENANYAQDLSDARKARKAAKKVARNKKAAINHRQAMQLAADVDVSLIEDPALYADAVNRYMAAIAPVTAQRYAPMSTKEFVDLLEKMGVQVDKAYKQLLMDEYGLDAGAELSAKELYEALEAEDIDKYADNLDAAKATELADRVAAMAEYRKLAAQEYTNEEISASQKAIVDDLKAANIERMTLQQQADYIRAVDNIVLNDAFYGTAYAAAIARNSVLVEDALKATAGRPVRRLFSPRLARTFMSQSDAFRFFFGMKPVVGTVQNRMGVGDFIRGKKKWSDEMKVVGQKMSDFYNALAKKHKTTYVDGSMTAEGMVAFAIQGMPGLDTKQSFEVRKRIIQQDIKEKLDMRGKLKREGETAQIVFDRMFADANTAEELLDNLKGVFPAARASIDFLISLSKPYRDSIKENAEDMWNEPGDYDDPYYIPIKFRGAPGLGTSLDPAEPKSVANKSLRPKQAKGTLARQGYRKLPQERLIDYNVRHNTYGTLSNDLYDVHTSRAQVRINEFLKLPEATSVFGSRENVGFVKDMMKKFLISQYEFQTDEAQFMNKVANTIRSWAVPRALGGFTQVMKQLPEAASQVSTILGGRVDLVFKDMLLIDRAKGLLDKYAIGDRAGIQGGSKWEGRVKLHTAELEAAIQNRATDKIKSQTEKIGRVLMYSLASGDALAAKAGWMALYEQERARQGHKVTSWEQEAEMHDSDQERQDAALYAESMVDQLMVSSDPAKMASISKKGGGGWENMGKAVLLPFSSFTLQATSRQAMDLTDLASYAAAKVAGNPRAEHIEAGAAARSLLARAIGTATFLAVSTWVAGGLRDLLAELWSNAFGDDDEGDKNLICATTVVHAMYLLGLMDVDVLRSFQKAERTAIKRDKSRLSKEKFEQTEAEKARVKNMKLFYTRLMTEMTMTGAQQTLSDKTVDFLNRLQYNTLVENRDPSVRLKNGGTMKFEYWLKDPANTTFYRYGQGWDAGDVSLGLIDVVRQNYDAAEQQYDMFSGDALKKGGRSRGGDRGGR